MTPSPLGLPDALAFARTTVVERMKLQATKLRLGLHPKGRQLTVLAGLIEGSNILRALRSLEKAVHEEPRP
jgi:hypothetical protein